MPGAYPVSLQTLISQTSLLNRDIRSDNRDSISSTSPPSSSRILADLRRVVAASTELRSYEPRAGGPWDEAAARLRGLVEEDDRARGLRSGP